MSAISKTDPTRAATSRPPYGVVAGVLVGTAALLLCIGWTLTELQQHLGTIRRDQMKLADVTGEIRYLNECMTMSAQMGAATGEAVWEKRYLNDQRVLTEAFANLANMSPDVYLREGGQEMDTVSDWLQSIEKRAFDLARSGKLTAARKELTNEEYANLKNQFGAGLDKVRKALGAFIDESSNALYHGLWLLVGISVGAVFIAGIVCVLIASRTHRRAVNMAGVMTAAVRKGESELRKLALVASKTDNSVLITDATGKIEWINDGFIRLTGFVLEEVRGTSPSALFQCPGADKVQLAKLERAFSEGNRLREEMVGFSKSGRKYWCSLDLEPIRDEDGNLVQFFAIQRDVTAKKEAGERMQKSNEEILAANQKLGEQARELARRTVELERASAAALAASTAKSEFLANMSHEIRTPLNGVVGAMELLDRTKLDARQTRYVRMASVSSATLLTLINDILDYSKFDAGKVELESIDINVAGLCGELNEMFTKRVEEKNISLSCEVSPLLPRIVRGDPTRLRQVLLNLISNAIKFTSAGGVVVRATPDLEEPEAVTVRFTVTDSGIGIPPDRIDRLFKSFSQVDASTTRRYGGTGLGLAICKSIVDNMGGQIGVSSEPGAGSTFWFTVPFALPAAATPAEIVASDRRLQDAQILCLSNDDQERMALATLLNSWKFRHREAAHDDAPSILADQKPGSNYDVVILHTRTIGDGVAMAHTLTTDPKNSCGSVLLLIDNIGTETIDPKRLRAAGVSVWIKRPATDSDLLDGVVAAIAACRKPVNAPPAVAPPPAPVRRSGPAIQVRVLVAEDNEVNQTITTELLTDAGYLCVVAPNGARAVEEVMSGKYDVVLMDCQMPELDGFEASQRIRQAEAENKKTARRGGRIPIVALTANALPPDRNRCLAAGMDDYLTKPLNAEAMIAAIQRHCPGPEHSPTVDSAALAAARAAVLEPAPPAPSLVVLDMEDLRNRCRNKNTLMASILTKFQEVAKQHVADSRVAVNASDPPRAATASHTLKGAAANVGARVVAAAAGELEQAAKAADLEGMKLAQPRLEAAIQELLSLIPATLKDLGVAPTEAAR